MFYYSINDSANPARNYGTDAAQRFLASNGARHLIRTEGPDSIGCYLATFDNGDMIEISRAEQVASGLQVKGAGEILPGALLNSHRAIKAWVNLALIDNARRKVAADMAAKAKAAMDATEAADIAYNAAFA